MDTREMIQQVARFKAVTAFTKECVDAGNELERIENGLGIAIANWADWDGAMIMRVFAYALEDANFHDHATEVRRWVNVEEGQQD